MPTLFLHIGTAKTGTTAIQQFLLQNRELLLQRFNLLVPCTGQDAQEGSHHPLAFSLGDNQDYKKIYKSQSPQQYARAMRLEVGTRQVDVLLTSECFNFARGAVARFVREVFPGHQVTLIMYARQIDLYLEAAWSEHVKGRIYTESFESFIQRFRYFNYTWPKAWEKSLGIDSPGVLVAPYETRQFYQQSLLDDLVHRLFGAAVPKGFQLPQLNSNPRLTRDALEYMLAVNASPVAREKKAGFRTGLINYSQRTDASTNDVLQPHDLLTLSRRMELIESVSSQDAKIAREYLGRESGQLFYRSLEAVMDGEPLYRGLSADKAIEISEFITGRLLPKLVFRPDFSTGEQVAAIVDRTAELM